MAKGPQLFSQISTLIIGVPFYLLLRGNQLNRHAVRKVVFEPVRY